MKFNRPIFQTVSGPIDLGYHRVRQSQVQAQAPRVSVGQSPITTALGGFLPERVIELASTPPSQVQATLDRINSSYVTLDGQVQSSGLQERAFLDGWAADKKSWDDFYNSNRGTASIVAVGPSSILKQAEQFRLRLVGWNAAFESLTGRKALLPPTGEEQPKSGGNEGGGGGGGGGSEAPPWWLISIGTLAVAGAVGYLGWKGYQLVTDAQETRRNKKQREDSRKVPGILNSPRLPPKTQERASKALVKSYSTATDMGYDEDSRHSAPTHSHYGR